MQDVIAVCKWAVDKLPAPSILLIGSSAGQWLSIFLQLLWFKAFCITICCSSSTSCFFLLLLLLLSPPFYFLLWCRLLTLVIVTHLQPQCLFFLLCTSLSANGHTQVLFLPYWCLLSYYSAKSIDKRFKLFLSFLLSSSSLLLWSFFLPGFIQGHIFLHLLPHCGDSFLPALFYFSYF